MALTLKLFGPFFKSGCLIYQNAIRLKILPQGMCKAHYGNQDLFPLANGVYFIVIINKMGVANDFEVEIILFLMPHQKPHK